MFSIKQMANSLGISEQAIYKQKVKLTSQGYMSKNDVGQWEINTEGYNYLKDKQISRLNNQKATVEQPTIEQVEQPIEQPYFEPHSQQSTDTLNLVYSTLINQLKESLATANNQIEELKREKTDLMQMYQEKDTRLNELTTRLLPPPKEEQKKTGFWYNLFK